MDIEGRMEMYITQAIKIELGEIDEPSESDRTARLDFWQSRTSADRMGATSEIVRRVHLAKGGMADDLMVNKNTVRIVRS